MSSLLGEFLIASVRIALVAAGVGITLAAARVRSGALRHAGWTAVLCAMLLMPALQHLTPNIGMRVATPAMAWDVKPRAAEFATVSESEIAPAPPVREMARAEAQPSTRVTWQGVALAIYLAGLFLLLARMAAGWLAARGLARAAKAVDLPDVYESDAIASPLIVGVARPRILLPRSWREWPESKLRGVLAHEAAHLRRRDALVAVAAGLNRCVFWFHPLAWWLQRKLAATAEQACDEAGVRAMGQGREYAEILLEMAEAVRCHGGRRLALGVGMYGAGSLAERIDRILKGEAARAVPARHKALVAAGCAIAIFIGAACQRTAAQGSPAAKWLESEEAHRLGTFYAGTLMAPLGMSHQWGVPMLTAEQYPAYAAEIRRKLESSQDPGLLLSAATPMLAWGKFGQKTVPGAFDIFDFGKSMVQKALQVDPQSAWAHQLMNVAADQELLAALPKTVWQGPLESRRRAIQGISEGDRFREMAILALAAGDLGVRAHIIDQNDAAAKAAWQQAAKYAREALELAGRAQGHRDYGTAFFQANMVLGREAIENGDPNAAADYLKKALVAPATDALKYPIPNARPWVMNWHFPEALEAPLLRAGKRDAVVEFLEAYSKITVAGRERCQADLNLLRQGKDPSFAGS